MDCREVEELLPAYSLDALSPEEAREVEAHLEGCPFCAALQREHVQVAASLAMAADSSAPPESLRRSTLRRVEKEARRGRRLSLPGLPLGRPAIAAAGSMSVVLVAALIAIGVVNVRMSDQIDDLESENITLAAQVSHLEEMDGKLEDMFQEQRSMSYFMASPDKETVPLRGDNAQGVLMISSQSGTGLLMARGLEPSSAGRGYYVLLRKNGQTILMGRLTVDDTGWGILTFWPKQPFSLFQQVVVSPETEMGAEGASAQPVLWGSITPR